MDSWVGKILWRMKWQPTPVSLPGKFPGQKSLAGYSPWDHKELNTTERARVRMCARARARAHTHTHTRDLSSQTRDGTCMPCTERWILNCRTITEVLFPAPSFFIPCLFYFLFFFFFFNKCMGAGEKERKGKPLLFPTLGRNWR